MTTDPDALHPLWAKHFGIAQKAKSLAPIVTTAKQATPALRPKLATAVKAAAPAVLPDFEFDGWRPTSMCRPEYGGPVTVKKRLSENVWASTTVLPGDSRYPWPDHVAPTSTRTSAATATNQKFITQTNERTTA